MFKPRMGKPLSIVRNILVQGFVVLCVPMVKRLLLDPDTIFVIVSLRTGATL